MSEADREIRKTLFEIAGDTVLELVRSLEILLELLLASPVRLALFVRGKDMLLVGSLREEDAVTACDLVNE